MSHSRYRITETYRDEAKRRTKDVEREKTVCECLKHADKIETTIPIYSSFAFDSQPKLAWICVRAVDTC